MPGKYIRGIIMSRGENVLPSKYIQFIVENLFQRKAKTGLAAPPMSSAVGTWT